ncbi:hypothetical protein [Pseudomonas amygdali]|uniref:hypothetical protein n=3 Tax=Pseudomonas amygdali TaxID=47877 RepID=UPI000F003681|nr:hypothetical protein [Pseudomonas amygdali]
MTGRLRNAFPVCHASNRKRLTVFEIIFPGLIILPASRVVMRLATLCAVLQRSLRIKALVYPDGTDDANCDLGDG